MWPAPDFPFLTTSNVQWLPPLRRISSLTGIKKSFTCSASEILSPKSLSLVRSHASTRIGVKMTIDLHFNLLRSSLHATSKWASSSQEFRDTGVLDLCLQDACKSGCHSPSASLSQGSAEAAATAPAKDSMSWPSCSFQWTIKSVGQASLASNNQCTIISNLVI